MHILGVGKALAIFIGETDRWHGKPLDLAIVERAKSEGLAGVTVTRGVMGFGANSRIHTASIVRLSEDLPVTIMAVDQAERIDSFLTILQDMVAEGLVITWDVNIELYRHSDEKA
jgi:PII-like signaling protein